MFGTVFGRFAGAAVACLAMGSVAAAGSDDPDMDFPDGWFAASEAQPATLTPDEVVAQVNAVFDLLDRHIFDAARTAAARAKARAAALEAVKTGPLDQKAVGEKIDAALQSIGYSHMALLSPELSRKLVGMTEGKSGGKPANAISARMEGDIGVLRVSSFMVPLFAQKDLATAMAKLRKAKVLVIDVSGNGGGNFSAAVALAHPLIGAGKLLDKDIERTAAPTPHDQFGPLPDDSNHGGAADNALNAEHGIVTWNTAKTPVAVNHRPTYLVIDGHCGSSCEVFSGGIKHYGAARLIGRNTAGKVLGSLAFRPPMKGYILQVPTSSVYGPAGEVYEGTGVAPDVELTQCQTSTDTAAETGACIAAALDYVKTQRL